LRSPTPSTLTDRSLSRPDLKGGTGIGELGLSLKPSPSLPLTIDLGVQGYTGTREGVTGSLRLKFEACGASRRVGDAKPSARFFCPLSSLTAVF
jgi:hypothetical protein